MLKYLLSKDFIDGSCLTVTGDWSHCVVERRTSFRA